MAQGIFCEEQLARWEESGRQEVVAFSKLGLYQFVSCDELHVLQARLNGRKKGCGVEGRSTEGDDDNRGNNSETKRKLYNNLFSEDEEIDGRVSGDDTGNDCDGDDKKLRLYNDLFGEDEESDGEEKKAGQGKGDDVDEGTCLKKKARIEWIRKQSAVIRSRILEHDGVRI